MANATQLTDISVLKNMEHQLNKEPWETYQILLAQTEKLADMSPNYKLWWLLRKAQAENSLYFFDIFFDTLFLDLIQQNL